MLLIGKNDVEWEYGDRETNWIPGDRIKRDTPEAWRLHIIPKHHFGTVSLRCTLYARRGCCALWTPASGNRGYA